MKKATNTHADRSRSDATRAKTRQKPRAPHVLTGGQPNIGVKDFSQMSHDEIDEYMTERARGLEAPAFGD